jgi:tetratricopeptide (TPR) repeat protein
MSTSEQPFTWFLGAGCSISSGIIAAGGLVEKWLNELCELQGNSLAAFNGWLNLNFPSFDSSSPALSYAEVFSRRHPSPVERQREIEMICSRGEPAYGYATLAQLMSHREFGRFCNTVLTTNFDDLIADALYLYGERNSRPLVVTHEALARYVRTNSPRPTVVKLHGDAHLDPKNLQPETREIDIALAKQLYPFVQDHALIFVGYGGNDQSILKFVRDCPVPALAPPIYWVSAKSPPPEFGAWLKLRNAMRVNHTDFDQLMHLIRNSLKIELLDRNRWTQIGNTYYEAFGRLRDEIERLKDGAQDTQALKNATSEADKSLPDDWSYVRDANRRGEENDRAEQERVLREGLSKFPESSALSFNLALLLDSQSNLDEAERYFQKSVELDPSRGAGIAHYARFVANRRKDLDRAEQLFLRGIQASPNAEYPHAAYGIFLYQMRNNLEKAEHHFRTALELQPTDIYSLMSYADFLDHKKEYDEALSVFQRAQNVAPNDAGVMRSLAMHFQRSGKNEEAEKYFKRSLELKKSVTTHAIYGSFLQYVVRRPEDAEVEIKAALGLNPFDEYARGLYADFLEKVRGNPEEATKFRGPLKKQ